MYRLKRDYPKTPKDGWSFPDSSGVVILGNDPDDLISKIAQHRMQNSLPEGRPDMEVTMYYAEHFPAFVEATEEKINILDPEPTDFLYYWTSELWRSPPPKMLPVKLAQNRINACVACPHREKWKADMKDAREVSIHRKLYILSQGHFDEKLGYCSANRAHAGLLCLIAKPEMKGNVKPCWFGKPDPLIDGDST